MSQSQTSPLAKRLKEAKHLKEIRQTLNIQDGDWDYLLVGDGSGTVWEKACGWAAVLVENKTFNRWEYFGGLNKGTNIVAELHAYVFPLMELLDDDGRISKDGFSRIHILTDCEYVVKLGNGRKEPKKHKATWMTFESFRRQGFILTFHWIPRDTIDMNKFCHEAANSTRRAMLSESHVAGSLQRVRRESIFDLDPS